MSGRRRPGHWVRVRLRNSLRIARWEVTKNAGGVDRRTVAIAVVAIAGMAAVTPLAASQGVALDAGIYRIGVDETSPYHRPATLDPTFDVTDPDRNALGNGGQEIYVFEQSRIDYANSQKGRAAVSELRSTVERYNDAVMTAEANESAAFPVVVNLTYRERPGQVVVSGAGATPDTEGDSGGDGDGGDASGDTDSDGATAGGDESGGSGGDDAGTGNGDAGTGSGDAGTGSDDAGTASTGGGSSEIDGTGGGAGDGTGGDGTDGQNTDVDGPSAGSPDAGSTVGGSSFTARLTGGTVSGTPSAIAPPFPFRSLVLAFLFVLPLNFVIQAYGSTILGERINRRGELLLVAPVSRGDIIVGKTLPYFAGAIVVVALIAAVLGGSIVSVLAVMPLALLFLATTFLGAMFARSFKELTFVTVTITVSLTSYAFVPAIFTDVIPIALISPLTLVVRDLQGQAIGLGEFVFSTAPPTLTALVTFVLGAGLYREEDMFTQRPIPLKVLDSLAGPIRGRLSAAKLSVMLLPFVLVTELVVIALLFALGELSIPLVLLSVAVVEELAKSLHVYAGYAHARFDRRVPTALVVGALSGLGFFLAEKLSLIARLTGLPDLEIGRAALNTGLVSGPLLVGFLVAPLALHVVTASISAVGASRSRRAFVAALAVAVAVHTVYNLAVVRFLVG